MCEADHGTIQLTGSIFETDVRFFVDEDVRYVVAQGLCNDAVGVVTVGNEQGGTGVKKRCERFLDLDKNFVVAGCEARRGNAQAVFFQTGSDAALHGRMPSQTKVVA